jgi:hypothetical protein
VGRIRKRGILPFQASHWKKLGTGERYGEGEIFAFENERDAIRWAARMDWALNQAMGTGKIAVIEFLSAGKWLTDTADPLGQAASEGRWLKSYAKVAPNQIIGSTRIRLKHIRGVTV